MNDIARALGRALVSQFHPRMLWLAVWPFLVSLVLWGVLGVLFRGPALAWLSDILAGTFIGRGVDTVFAWVGLDSGVGWLAFVVYLGSVFSLMIVTAILLIATLAMPTVVAHVGQRHYPELVQKRGGSYAASLVNAVVVTIVFVIGFIVTLPLWMIPPLGILVPLLWWGWATARMFRYDALVVHASSEERNTLIAKHGRAFFAIGTSVSLLNFVPPFFFLVPILGGLAFTHYGLHALQRLREERGEGVLPSVDRRIAA